MDVSQVTLADIKRKLRSKRLADVYNACIEIRKKVIKAPRGINRLIRDNVIPILLEILKRPSTEPAQQQTDSKSDDSYRSKVSDIVCSILGNMCMEAAAREEVLKHDGINILGNILCTTEVESIQNRCSRCLANISLNPCAWKLVHATEVIERIVKLLKESENAECQQTYIRALRLLGQTGPFVQKLLDNNAVSAVMKHIDSDQEPVARSAMTCITHLLTRRSTVQFASQVVSSGKLPHLIGVVKETKTSHDALLILIELAEHHNFRPAFGNAGGMSLFINLLVTGSFDSFSVKEKFISVLCLCCKEAVNRVKLREEGALKLFIEFLKDNSYKSLHLRIVSALVCFLYDEASFDVLLDNGLVPVLVSHLRCYLDEDYVAQPISEYRDGSNGDTEGYGKDKANFMVKEKETLVKDKADSMDTNQENSFKSGTENIQKGNGEEIHSSDGQVRDENSRLERDDSEKLNVGESEFVKESMNIDGKTDTENMLMEMEENIGSNDPLSLSVTCADDVKPSTSTDTRVYSIDSPSYQVQTEDFSDYSSGAKCKKSFSPPSYLDSSYEVYSPISNVSYYSPVKSSPEYSPQSDRAGSPVGKLPLYSYAGLGSPYDEAVSSPESGISKSGPSGQSSPSYSIDEQDPSWSWSPGASQDSDSESESEAGISDKGAQEMKKPDVDCLVKKKRNNKKSCDGRKRTPDCKKSDTTEAETFVIEKIPTQKTGKKRKKSDTVMENNILILLSRVSQMTNPTVHFVSTETITCLLNYITDIEAPLARAARLLSRVFRNPHCFQKLLTLKIPVIVYQKLLQNENIPVVLKRIQLLKKEEKRSSMSSGFRSRSSSISSISSDSDRFSLFEERIDDEGVPAKRQRGSSSAESIKREVKGMIHKQAEEVCDTGKCGISFLEDLAGVAESPYGRGVIEKLLRQDDGMRENVCLSSLFICRNQGTIDFFHKLDILNNIFTILEDSQLFKKTIIQGLSLLAHLLNFKSRFQNSGQEIHSKSSVEKAANYINSQFRQNMDIGLSQDIESGKMSIDPLQVPESLFSEENKFSGTCKGCIHSIISCLLHSGHTCVTTDLTFIVKGETLVGSRNMLTKSSELFAAMLKGHFSESGLSEILLPETSKFAFKYILHYLHGCKLQGCDIRNYFLAGEVSPKSSCRLVKVLREADKYLLHDLKSELQNMLFIKYIIPEMSPDIFEYAAVYENAKIKKAAVSCLLVDASSVHQLLMLFQKCLSSKFCGVFLNTLMELLLD